MHTNYIFKFDTSLYPEDAEKFVIMGNETLLRLAFSNLMENACKFSIDHTAMIKSYINTNGDIVVDIIDHAPKISKSDMESIFNPFYRSSVTKKIKGSGIGLSLVTTITKLHGADLTIQNNDIETIGNIFTVIFKSKAT
jgi:K+-sensing histidine kinase KdpD